MNNKANTTFILIGVLISILSFFIITGFISNVGNKVVSSSEDLSCRAFLSSQSNDVVKFANYFYNLNLKCKKDEIKVSSFDREKIFETVADETARCWYRYGEGKYDFLKNLDSAGNRCFVCGRVSFKNDMESYSYLSFIEWIGQNEYKRDDNGKSILYSDYLNLKYTNVSENEVMELNTELANLINDGDSNFQYFAFILSEQIEGLNDLRLKKIDTKENLYVVYRYDRASNMTNKMTNAAIGTGAGLVTGVVVSSIAESIIWMGVGAIACPAAIVTSPTVVGGVFFGSICALSGAKTVGTIAKSGYKSTKSISKLVRLNKLMDKMKLMVKFTKKAKLANKVRKFSGKTDDLGSLSLEVAKIDPKFATHLDDIYLQAKKLKIDDLTNINSEILKSKDKIELNKLFSQIKDSEFIDSDLIKLGKQENKIITKQINNFKDLQKKVDLMNDVNTPDALMKKSEYIRSFFALTSAAVGSYVGYNLDFDNNQYVDIMTQEQYYRLCGTEPLGIN